ncbi:hypothetical protein MUK42_04934 [Musa troglodytarum]|uniref:Uncharacterized protein n=1 Tax=Musa troglodytarum TaxID=320322 RepID=A0A9E7KET5_9LILI|nr:hypothetical protein MUK42_04934 [Musa troglodytarum]
MENHKITVELGTTYVFLMKNGSEFLLTDTVGFIQKLPTMLEIYGLGIRNLVIGQILIDERGNGMEGEEGKVQIELRSLAYMSSRGGVSKVREEVSREKRRRRSKKREKKRENRENLDAFQSAIILPRRSRSRS